MYMVREYSAAGTAHNKNQDVVRRIENGRFQVIALADGVGSCVNSGTGAEIACSCVMDLFEKSGKFLMNLDDKKARELVSSHVAYHLQKQADEMGIEVHQLASTLSAAMIDQVSGWFFYYCQGDSPIFFVCDGRIRYVQAEKDRGEGICATTTVNGYRKACFGRGNADQCSSVVVMSDGAADRIYRKNRMVEEAKQALLSQDYAGLIDIMKQKEGPDDCSFIAASVRQGCEKSIDTVSCMC